MTDESALFGLVCFPLRLNWNILKLKSHLDDLPVYEMTNCPISIAEVTVTFSYNLMKYEAASVRQIFNGMTKYGSREIIEEMEVSKTSRQWQVHHCYYWIIRIIIVEMLQLLLLLISTAVINKFLKSADMNCDLRIFLQIKQVERHGERV